MALGGLCHAAIKGYSAFIEEMMEYLHDISRRACIDIALSQAYKLAKSRPFIARLAITL